MGRKLHFVLSAVFALVVMVFGFGDIAEARTRRSVRFDSVALRNTGELPQELRFEFYEVRRGGRIARQPRQKFTIGLAGGGSFRWERLRIGKVYLVKVTRITAEADELILTLPYVALRGVEGRVIEIPGEAAPVDPRDAEIAARKAQVAALELEMQAKNANIEALLAQIASLQQRIADLLAGTPVTGPALTVTTSLATPPAKIVVMGSTDNALFTVRLAANGVDDLQESNLVVNDSVTGGQDGVASFTSLTLWNGATKVADPTSMSMSGGYGTVTFALMGNGTVTPKNGSIELTVKGTVATWSSGGAVSGSQHSFTVVASGVTVRSVGSPTTAVTVLGSATSNTITVARTKLSLSVLTYGSGIRARVFADNLAALTVGADMAYQAQVNSLQFMFTGGAATYQGGAPTLSLVDTNQGHASQVNAQWNESRQAWVATVPLGYVISAGAFKTWQVQTDSSNFPDAAGVLDSLTVTLIGGSWSDGVTTFGFDPTILPLTMINTSY